MIIQDNGVIQDRAIRVQLLLEFFIPHIRKRGVLHYDDFNSLIEQSFLHVEILKQHLNTDFRTLRWFLNNDMMTEEWFTNVITREFDWLFSLAYAEMTKVELL